MPKFRVDYSKTEYYTIELDAKNESEAKKLIEEEDFDESNAEFQNSEFELGYIERLDE